MDSWIQQHELTLRLGAFFGVLVLMMLWEQLAPRRPYRLSRRLRWSNNLGLVVLNTVILRLLFPAAAVGVALFANERQWGVLHLVAWPGWLEVILGVVILDFAIYLQHVMVHAVPVLWRLHRVHHADPDFDVTTGLRFHPIEIVLSMLIKFGVIVLIGPAVLAVVLFEILLNATSMFNHSNIRIPLGIDRWLRWLVVTPDMHRVHHSVEDDETNSNFGFNLPWWDRLMDTYRDQPRAGHDDIDIGIHHFRNATEVSHLGGMLWLPFRGKISEYAINRRYWTGEENESDRK